MNILFLGIVVLKMPPQVIIAADASLIYSIFRNLIDNVIAYATDTAFGTSFRTLLPSR